jgi:transposase-like protein
MRWYLRYKLSYRDLVEMMAERGVAHDDGCSASRRCLSNAGIAMHA